MKLKVGIVALGFVLGCSALAKTPADNDVVATIYELETLFWEQQYKYLPLSLPPEDVFVLLREPVVPVNWKKFPSKFTSLMYAQMDANGYPIYKVSVYEDPATRETVFLNSYGTEACRLSPEANYDPFAWQTDYFGLAEGEELEPFTQWIFDPANIAFDFTLIPEVFHADYLATQEEEVVLESMMMALPAVVTNLLMAINNTTNGAVELEIGWPASFTNDLEIFATTDLIENIWEVIHTDITTLGETNYPWTDWASTNTPNRFYIASNCDVDSDGDGLADGREIYVYGSDPDKTDSDDDGLDDDVEVGASPPTDPWDDDRQAPVILIASPVNNIVVVP